MLVAIRAFSDSQPAIIGELEKPALLTPLALHPVPA
jgi:hypothetical protein